MLHIAAAFCKARRHNSHNKQRVRDMGSAGPESYVLAVLPCGVDETMKLWEL